MSVVLPTVRVFIVCEEILPHPERPDQVLLSCPLASIRPYRTPAYPYIHDELGFFAYLTECRGEGMVGVRIRHDETAEVVSALRSHPVKFPNNPLAMYQIRFRRRKCRFPVPGTYVVELCYNDIVLRQYPIRLY